MNVWTGAALAYTAVAALLMVLSMAGNATALGLLILLAAGTTPIWIAAAVIRVAGVLEDMVNGNA